MQMLFLIPDGYSQDECPSFQKPANPKDKESAPSPTALFLPLQVIHLGRAQSKAARITPSGELFICFFQASPPLPRPHHFPPASDNFPTILPHPPLRSFPFKLDPIVGFDFQSRRVRITLFNWDRRPTFADVFRRLARFSSQRLRRSRAFGNGKFISFLRNFNFAPFALHPAMRSAARFCFIDPIDILIANRDLFAGLCGVSPPVRDRAIACDLSWGR